MKHNLVPLCKKCHSETTYGKLRIYGYKDTNEGLKLNYEYIDSSVLNRKKYSQEEIDIINNCWSDSQNKKECLSKLELKYNIKISITTFNKIISMNY